MTQAVIVSTARTPIGKAYRGLFNNTEAPTMAGHAIRAAVERAGIEGGEVDDVIMGCAMPQGTQSLNVGRMAALAGGLPVTVSGMTMDRQCSSGLMAIATAAKQVLHDGMRIVVGYPAGGVTDIAARVVGEMLAKKYGQSVVVENRSAAMRRICSGFL